MRDNPDERERRLMEREEGLAEARAVIRAERERLADDQNCVERLLLQAASDRREASAERARARKLAARFIRRFKYRHIEERREFAVERTRLAEQIAHLNASRSAFRAEIASSRDRLRLAWTVVEEHQKRCESDWTEANRFIAEQSAALDERSAQLDRRELVAADLLGAAEAETAGLREEAAALELRVRNARAALADVERRRDRAREELLRTTLPADVPAPDPNDLAHRELLLEREKGAVAALRSSLELEATDLEDRRRLMTEQLKQLAEARARWQQAERQTVAEMEELARALAHREQSLDAREMRLVRADTRRCEDAHDLWRLRLRLEAWQSKLTAAEMRWHTDREELEANLRQRLAAVARREAAAAATFAHWEQARAADHARLRAELERWSADRETLARVAGEFDRRHAELAAEVAAHAARALAAEELVAEGVRDSGSTRATRRLAVLRRRWERVMGRMVKAVTDRRAEAVAELAAIESRYHELDQMFTDAVDRHRTTGEPAEVEVTPLPERRDVPSAASEELAALRTEVERLAACVIEIEFPGLPELAELEGVAGDRSEPASPDPLPHGGDARAA